VPRLLPLHKLKPSALPAGEARFLTVEGFDHSRRAHVWSLLLAFLAAKPPGPAPPLEAFFPRDRPYVYLHSPEPALLKALGAHLLSLPAGTLLPNFPLRVSPSYPAAKVPAPPLPGPESTPSPVPGLLLLPSFRPPAPASRLLTELLTSPDWGPPQRRKSGGAVRRKVAHYGYTFDYETSDILRDGERHPLPPPVPAGGAVGELFDRVRSEDFGPGAGVRGGVNQVTVNDYPPGTGIGHHVDTRDAFDGCLVSVSLGSGVVMEFRKGEERK
jgi:alkylated DNA repair dioxygenase AlkB